VNELCEEPPGTAVLVNGNKVSRVARGLVFRFFKSTTFTGDVFPVGIRADVRLKISLSPVTTVRRLIGSSSKPNISYLKYAKASKCPCQSAHQSLQKLLNRPGASAVYRVVF
jgi:hypothetical protein